MRQPAQSQSNVRNKASGNNDFTQMDPMLTELGVAQSEAAKAPELV